MPRKSTSHREKTAPEKQTGPGRLGKGAQRSWAAPTDNKQKSLCFALKTEHKISPPPVWFVVGFCFFLIGSSGPEAKSSLGFGNEVILAALKIMP